MRTLPNDPRLAQSRAELRRPRAAKALKPRSVDIVRMPGTDLEVLLPRGTNFARYIRSVIKTGAFPERHAELKQLLAQVPTPSKLRDDAPRIGVLLVDPAHLIPGMRQSAQLIIDGILALGGQPVLIPPGLEAMLDGGPTQRVPHLRAMTAHLDGLVGPGGADVNPRVYWRPNTASQPRHNSFGLDQFHADLVKTGLRNNLYYFGICRSHQLVNAIKGAAMVQDIEKDGFVSHTHNQEAPYRQPRPELMRITTVAGEVVQHPLSFGGELSERMGTTRALTNAVHHQGVATAGRELEVVSWSDDEQTGRRLVEGTRAWNLTSVQYHPEARRTEPVDGAPVFSLVARAWAFMGVRQLEGTLGRKPRVSELGRWLKARQVLTDPTDARWLKNELGPALGLPASAR